MEPAVITAHSPKFTKTPTKPVNTRDSGDAYFMSLIDEIKRGLKTPSVNREEVMRAIASGSVSPKVVEELEDAILVSFMEEAYRSERVSREEVMKSLKR